MNRFRKKFTLAALVAVLTFTACDEGQPPPIEVPPPPPPVGTISGTVTIEGTAASGVTATLSSGATTTTGSGGNFAFSGVEAGTYTVTISGFPEDATFASPTQSATIATNNENVQLTFAGEYVRSSAVVGNVVAADAMMSGGDGQPETLAGVTVTLGGDHAMGETMETDEVGGFAFTGLRAGTYSVTISDFPEDVSFETVSIEVEVDAGDVGQADFTGHFIRTAAVEGQVIIEGEGLAGVTVSLSGGPADESHTSMTDADGMYRFEELRPGDYTVAISDFDPREYEFASTSQDVSVDLDETGTVSFTGVLLRTSGISGRVSVDGMGLEGVAVMLSGAADDTTMTDAGGQYAFAGLAAGDYTVSIAVESDAYVFDEMSEDRTVGDDDSQIVNFEGAHARTSSVSGMLFIDEAMKNDSYDEGEDAFPNAAMLQALQAAGVQLPPMLPVPITLVGPGVNESRSGSLNLATGQYSFGDLRAGNYELRVGSLASLLPALPPAAAAVLRDFEYGGPAAGYELEVAVGEDKTQNVPVDITHTTAHFVVTLKSGDARGMPVPGATVSLSSGGSGMTGDNGLAMIRFARAGTTGNTVNASVAVEGYDVADGMTAVAWDPKSPHTRAMNANDIVNLNVDVSVSGATITTAHPKSGQPLKGWAISVMSGEDSVAGAPGALDDDGNASLKVKVAVADLPVDYSFAVVPDSLQDNKLDGGESYKGTSVEYVHDGLSLAGTRDAGAIEVRYTTQTLKVYVHEERDQVEGYTGNLLGGDRRVSGKVSALLDVRVRYIAAANGRSRAFTKDEWDAARNTKDDGKGGLTFSHLPADENVIVMADEKSGQDVMVLDPDELAAYTGADYVMGGAFGAGGGSHHTVSLCPLMSVDPTGQDHGECGSFAYVNTHNVSGLVWKREVALSTTSANDDAFKISDPVFVRGISVGLDPVPGKNLAGDSESYTTAAKNDTKTPLDETHQFDFGRIASGAYNVDLSDGWRAKRGGKGSEAPLGNALSPLLDNVILDVTPATGTVYGYVRDSRAFPVSGVTVTVNGQSNTTDVHGRYIVDGFGPETRKIKNTTHANRAFVETAHTGNQATLDHYAFAANTLQRHDITLSGVGRTASISGKVTAEGSGEPVAGVEIRVDGEAPTNKATSGANKGKLLTGADGKYTALVPAKAAGQTAAVSASKAGMNFIPARLDAPAHAGAEISGINFTGYLHATISGRVRGPDGNAMGGVSVTATSVVDGGAGDAVSSTTNARGTFVLSVPFGTYDIEASAENHTFAHETRGKGPWRMNVLPGQPYDFGYIDATYVPPPAPNNPPAFSSSSAFLAAENQRAVGTVRASDPDAGDGAPSYDIIDGDDLAALSIDKNTGVLVFNRSPDFEKPGDLNTDNNYEIVVEATSGTPGRVMTATQAITVTVTDMDERIPQVTLVLDPSSIPENGGVSRITATVDPVSAAAFDVTVSAKAVTPAVAGDFVLSNNMTLSFEANAASSSGAVSITALNNNVYAADKTVRVSGSVSSTDVTDPAAVDLTIAEDDEKPAPEATLSSLSLSGVEAADLGFDPARMRYAVSVANDVEETTVAARASEGATAVITPNDADGDDSNGHQVALAVGDTEIRVVVTAPGGKRADYVITVTRMDPPPPPNEPPTFKSSTTFKVAEGKTVVGTVVATDPDDAVTGYKILDTGDGSMLDIDTSTGVLEFRAAPDYENAGDLNEDNDYEIEVTATSGTPGRVMTATQAITVTVTDVDERIPQVTLVLDPASVSENGGVSRITATVDPVSAAAFDVAVSAMAVDPAVAGDFILSNNMTLSFAANEASSSGAVSITAVNNNDYADDKTVRVSGSVSSTDVTEPDDVDLTIREDDVKPPAEATLSSLSLSGVEAADLGFDPATMTYAVSVANEVEETTVDAMASEGATVTAITPADADAAMAGHQVALAVGDTDITVVVTAPGGKRADYEITVTRMKSSDASLSSVTVNGDAVTADADGNYAHDVANGVTEATVVAMAVEGASVSYDPSDGDDSDGSMIDLDVGPNMVTVTVTAANDSTMDYTVTVNRAASSDVSLAHFTVGTDTITADEDDGTYTHETSGEQVTVSAMAGHDSATAMITDPVDADDDEDGHQVDIAVGDTEITATVTAEDGTSTATYTLTITRDATAGISVSMEEFDLPEGDTTTYRVSLATMPTTSVTVGIVAAGGLTIDKSSLVFAPENYHVAQIVRVIADENDSGAGAFEDAELDLTHTVTAGPDSYFGDTPKSKVVTVNVENDDAEGAAATLVPTTLTIEEGKTDSIGVTLGDPDGSATDGKPLGNVTVTIEAADTSRAREVRLSRSSLRFTPDNFRDTLYVRVTAVDNDIDNGASNVDDVVLAFEASGGGYDDLVGEITGGVTVSIEDDDTAAIMVTDLTGRQVREGGTLSYDVKLGSQPEGRVSILVDGGTTHNAAFTFDHTNWSQAQSRTITVPQDDNEADETVTLTFSQSGYVDLAGDPPAFTVKDNDGDAGAVIVSHTAMSIAAGGSDTYTLSLTQAPAVGETFKVTIGSLGQINIDPLGEVEFNRSNWNTGVRVTLSPLGQASGSISVTNAAAASTGGDDDDAKYRAGTDGTSVTVTIPDSS